MDNFLIRPANKNDVKPIADLEKICFSLPWSERYFFEEITKNKIARYAVVEIEGKIVGYAGIWLITDKGYITSVAVHPEFRRKGIAKELVSSLMEMSYGEGVKTYTLEVRISNKEAISLYKRLNFKECGIRRKYYEDNSEDAIIMKEIKA